MSGFRKRPLGSVPLPPGARPLLTQNGFHFVEDLLELSPEQLQKDIGISHEFSQAIFTATQAPKGSSLTQSAAAMVDNTSEKIPTLCTAVDELLDGGLTRGSVLEISGPPGSGKESLAVNIAKSFLKNMERVIFVDMQNMTSPTQLRDVFSSDKTLSPTCTNLVYHMSLFSIPELMVFLHTLPSYLGSHRKPRLLVLNSIWFTFQSSAGIPHSSRTAVLDKLKDALAKACVSSGLSVVITTQLATKLVNADGSPANFDTGVRAVMVPQLGSRHLPAGRSYSLMIIPHTRTTGVIRLLLSPSRDHEQLQAVIREEPYEMGE